jgi:hypothetical protein
VNGLPDGVGEARPEAEGELTLARIALDSGETAHAAAHAGNAIASDPTLRDAYDLLDGDIAHLVMLADWWRAPGHEYAGDTLTWACQGRVWLGQAPWPGEAICNMLRQAIDDGIDLEGTRHQAVQLALSALEVPSAFAAVKSALPGLAYTGDPPTPAPDIGVPLASGRYRLWTYSGVYPAPAVPAPPAAAIAALHAMPSPCVWLDHPAAAYDASVTLAGLSVDDLLGLMAHVPPPPAVPGWCREVHRIHRHTGRASRRPGRASACCTTGPTSRDGNQRGGRSWST